jgi:antitoxin component YwqK of YwqJK toxin-antitoxin module
MPIHRQETDDEDMVWPPDDFSGEWVVEWPNGQIKFRSLYLDGKEEGTHLCYWSNGNLAQRGKNLAGECIGIWSDYWEDGTRYRETLYYSPGNFDVRWLTDSGQVKEIEVVRDGQERQCRTLIADAEA